MEIREFVGEGTGVADKVIERVAFLRINSGFELRTDRKSNCNKPRQLKVAVKMVKPPTHTPELGDSVGPLESKT